MGLDESFGTNLGGNISRIGPRARKPRTLRPLNPRTLRPPNLRSGKPTFRELPAHQNGNGIEPICPAARPISSNRGHTLALESDKRRFNSDDGTIGGRANAQP